MLLIKQKHTKVKKDTCEVHNSGGISGWYGLVGPTLFLGQTEALRAK